jgi:hypothetical protein
MSEQFRQLQDLRSQLHEVDGELVLAAKPLAGLGDLSLAQREQVAARIRAALARWEAVTKEISQVLQTASPKPGDIQ